MTQIIDLPNSEIMYMESFFVPTDCQYFFKMLREELKWKEMDIRLYGKVHKQPRLSSWHGDPGSSYTYSKMTLEPLPWTETLLEIRKKVQLEAGVRFNSVLANLYRNGQDSMGFHSDDEPELGKEPVIVSVSLGATRTFRLRHKKDESIPKYDLELKNGDVLIMKGESQQYWKHEIPKTQQKVGERINLTFRTILSS